MNESETDDPPKTPSGTTSEWTEVHSSGIHQRGLFARKAIPKGTRFIEYTGDRIIKPEAERRGLVQDEKGQAGGSGTVYIFTLNDRFDIDGGTIGNNAKYANHSCDPNTESEISENRVWLIALRDIKKGEEIVYDYSFDLEHFRDHPCRCGSDNCVGYIVGEEHRKKLGKILRREGKSKGKSR